MNKTIKTIAIVFLVLGGLAAIGGAALGFGNRLMMRPNQLNNGQQNMPMQPYGRFGTNGREMMSGRVFFLHRGFFGSPGWLIGSGLTFLIAGAVLLIFNRKISDNLEPDKEGSDKPAKKASAPVKKAAETRKTTSKKTTSS